MPKNKKPARKAPPPPAPDRTDELIEDLAVLAAEVVEQGADPAAADQKMDELEKMVRNALRKKQDEVLYGAVEHTSYDNPGAYVLLRGEIEQAAAAIVLRAENKPAEEIDAFLVPVFVNSVGGLRREEAFADPAGFELLRASFQAAGLESAAATVVLISHLYDIDEIDALSYCEVNEMLREVAATMGGKNAPMPVLERSIAAENVPHAPYAPEDEVTELRFLLGFVRRRVDDPAYAIPEDEAGSDAWFEARMDKYRAWTAAADGLLRACISADPSRVTLNFLFQNQFFAAKRQAMAEADLLSLMAELGELFDAHELEPEQCSAVVGPVARETDIALRVAIYRNGDAAPLASVELPYDLGDDLTEATESLCDILHNLGMASLSTADGFGVDGQPQQLAPWTAE